MTKVVRYRAGGDDEPRLGVVDGDQLRDAGVAPPQGFIPDAAGWERAERAGGSSRSLGDVELLPPVTPRNLICVGLNYRDHAEESGMPIPTAPLLFAKLLSSLSAHGRPIVIPDGAEQVDYEAEMAIVISRRARNVAEASAADVIGGYTGFNDVSARAAQLGDGQWTRGKGPDTFGPLGPAIVSAADADLSALPVRCRVNGEVLQDGNTCDMIFPVEAVVAYVTRWTTLEPGDVIATGTPAGVGLARKPPRWLGQGDVVEVEVGDAGVLRNPVVGG